MKTKTFYYNEHFLSHVTSFPFSHVFFLYCFLSCIFSIDLLNSENAVTNVLVLKGNNIRFIAYIGRQCINVYAEFQFLSGPHNSFSGALHIFQELRAKGPYKQHCCPVSEKLYDMLLEEQENNEKWELHYCQLTTCIGFY